LDNTINNIKNNVACIILVVATLPLENFSRILVIGGNVNRKKMRTPNAAYLEAVPIPVRIVGDDVFIGIIGSSSFGLKSHFAI
jgi:hypothetical protein